MFGSVAPWMLQRNRGNLLLFITAGTVLQFLLLVLGTVTASCLCFLMGTLQSCAGGG